jgi:CheY-like chemotaxis protein
MASFWAWKKFNGTQQDVLLLDFEMPEMSGLKPAGEITRRSPGRLFPALRLGAISIGRPHIV